MKLRSALLGACSVVALSGTALAETITIATVNNGDMIRMQRLAEQEEEVETGGREVERGERRLRPRVAALQGGGFEAPHNLGESRVEWRAWPRKLGRRRGGAQCGERPVAGHGQGARATESRRRGGLAREHAQ